MRGLPKGESWGSYVDFLNRKPMTLPEGKAPLDISKVKGVREEVVEKLNHGVTAQQIVNAEGEVIHTNIRIGNQEALVQALANLPLLLVTFDLMVEEIERAGLGTSAPQGGRKPVPAYRPDPNTIS